MDERIEARLIDLESRMERLEGFILSYVQWLDETKGPLDWDKLIASPAGVTWFGYWTQLFKEYEELPKTFDETAGTNV